jgi:hypothetical protein
MRAVKLRIVEPVEAVPERPRVAWRPVLRTAWVVVCWVLGLLWEMTKLAVIVVGILIGLLLMFIGVLGHFWGGPPR